VNYKVLFITLALQDAIVPYELLRFNSTLFWEAFTALLVCEMRVLF